MSARQNLLTVQKLISQSKATIARGYGVKDLEVNLLVTEPCFDGTDDWCERSSPTLTDETFAIDLRAERRKLRNLLATEISLRARAEETTQQCAARHGNG